MKISGALLSVAVLTALCSAQAKPKPAAKPTATPTVKPAPTPTGAPPGYEIARFVPATIRGYGFNGPFNVPKDTTAPDVGTRHTRRGPVYLPKGAANVALHKPVSSSDAYPIHGTLGQITDGDKETGEEHWVEIGPGTQWVQIDLQESYDIHGVLLWHYVYEPRIYRDVVIRLTDDAAFTKHVRTVYNNDDDNSSGLGKGTEREFYESQQGQWIPFKTSAARYVRLYSRGNTSDLQNQYIEVEIWATPAKTATAK